jgi:membrane-bound lytic murein transglycosylase MltF
MHYKQNTMQQKYCKQKQIVNADYVTNLRRQQTSLCQRAQYWQKNNTSSDMIECAQLHFNTCKELGVKLDSELWYEHVPKSVETSQVGKVTVLWN